MFLTLSLVLSIVSVNAGSLPGQPAQFHRNFNEISMGCLLPFGNFDGAPVGIGDCLGEPGAQAWTIDSGGQFSGAPTPAVVTKIRVFGNKCLDNTNGNVVNGNKLQIWTCVDGNTNQNWFVNNNLTVSLAGTGKCVDNTNGNTTFGNQAQLWDCNPANSNQQWEVQTLSPPGNGLIWTSFAAGAQISAHGVNGAPITAAVDDIRFWSFPVPALPGQIGNTVFCADVTNGVNADGTRLQMFNCTPGNTNQIFQARGGPDVWTIHWVGTDKCMDLTNGDTSLPVQIWTCIQGNTNQLWRLTVGGG